MDAHRFETSRSSSLLAFSVGTATLALCVLAYTSSPATSLVATHAPPQVLQHPVTTPYRMNRRGSPAFQPEAESTPLQASQGPLRFPVAARGTTSSPTSPSILWGILPAASIVSVALLVWHWLSGRRSPMHIAMAATGAEKFTTAEQQASYGIGLQIGAELLNGLPSFPLTPSLPNSFTPAPPHQHR